MNYLERDKIKTYVALEPNLLMHPIIREQASKHNFNEDDGSLLILSYGAHEPSKILSVLPPVDTIVSVLTLCSVPRPEDTIRGLVRDILKPGGQFLFYEHVLSHRSDVAWWQRLWTPIWTYGFDGCRLDRPSHLYLRGLTEIDGEGREMSVWREGATWGKKDEPEENVFWHQAGRFVKR